MLDDGLSSILTECIKLMDISIIDFQISMKPEFMFLIDCFKEGAIL